MNTPNYPVFSLLLFVTLVRGLHSENRIRRVLDWRSIFKIEIDLRLEICYLDGGELVAREVEHGDEDEVGIRRHLLDSYSLGL